MTFFASCDRLCERRVEAAECARMSYDYWNLIRNKLYKQAFRGESVSRDIMEGIRLVAFAYRLQSVWWALASGILAVSIVGAFRWRSEPSIAVSSRQQLYQGRVT